MPPHLNTGSNNRFVLQWHITERCNLRCQHCYQEAYPPAEPAWTNLLEVVCQFKLLLQEIGNERGRLPPAQITVTGGEPLIRNDIFDLLELLHKNRKYFSFAILTNGTLLDPDNVKRIQKLRPSFVQISLEGGRQTHEKIRGQGSYDKTLTGLDLLARHAIPSLVSFTAHAENFLEFPAVVEAARRLGASRIWADRLIPLGNGAGLRKASLTPEQTSAFLKIMLQEKTKEGKWWFRPATTVSMNRALQFLAARGRPYHCPAGDSLLTVMPNGDVVPCRRLPIVVGNLFHQTLTDLYFESNLLNLLRDNNQSIAGCEQCQWRDKCRGGLRCLAYALTSDPFGADPGCPLAKRN